jgi:hypothetical protein
VVFEIFQLVLFLLLFILGTSLYKRYYPVKGYPCIDQERVLKDKNVTILDIRDYNETELVSGIHIINIPYAYLKRHYKEIPNDKIHVVAENKLELNLGIRLLKEKGIKIGSYMLKNCPCQQR